MNFVKIKKLKGLITIVTSNNKKEPKLLKCEAFGKCGGCESLNVEYKKQLAYKTFDMIQLFRQKCFFKDTSPIKGIIKMDNPYYYRNKGKYVVGTEKGKTIIGFYKEGTHEIVPTTSCKLHNQRINNVAELLLELIQKYKITPYNEDTKRGILRYIVIRYALKTDEMMVIFVTTKAKISRREQIVEELLEKFPNIKTIVQNINEKENSAVLGDVNVRWHGSGYIVDKLGEYKFKISPVSFYQVNPIQTEKLYTKAIEYADLTGKETVYDLYSGIGTISLFASKYAKKVIGIEIVKDAVKDAIENAKLNKVENVKFYAGNVEKLLPQIINKEKRADVIFVDPPRSGLEDKTIETLLEVEAQKIVYISCNPETLAENIIKLKKKYNVKEIQMFDMFPMTRTC